MKPRETLTLADTSPKENEAVFDAHTQLWIWLVSLEASGLVKLAAESIYFHEQKSLLIRLIQLEI